ncbi:hypothetical protein GGF32_006371 [Allomyces javanicus]|nr:hypothetical protein GGF32_006371 [Allomyces javanicus]
MYHKRDAIRAGIVVNGSERCSPYYRDFIPDSYIYDDYEPDIIEGIMKHQQSLIRKSNFNKSYDNTLRSNFDFVFIFAESNLISRRKLHENFCGMVTFKEFSTLMDSLTADYSCMVINNSTSSTKPEDKIFFYKAQLNIPKFRVGDTKYWLVHDQRYNQNYDNEPEDLKKSIVSTKNIISTFAPDNRSVKIIIKQPGKP